MKMKQGLKINSHGTKFWYVNDKLHSEDDRPAAEFTNGDKHWFQYGQRHRADGPAVSFINGQRHWYRNDVLHRIDGPALQCNDPPDYWYIDGIQISEIQFNQHPLVLMHRFVNEK